MVTVLPANYTAPLGELCPIRAVLGGNDSIEAGGSSNKSSIVRKIPILESDTEFAL